MSLINWFETWTYSLSNHRATVRRVRRRIHTTLVLVSATRRNGRRALRSLADGGRRISAPARSQRVGCRAEHGIDLRSGRGRLATAGVVDVDGARYTARYFSGGSLEVNQVPQRAEKCSLQNLV
jgi:hypothetical protein